MQQKFLGKMKGKNNRVIMEEFVGLRCTLLKQKMKYKKKIKHI